MFPVVIVISPAVKRVSLFLKFKARAPTVTSILRNSNSAQKTRDKRLNAHSKNK